MTRISFRRHRDRWGKVQAGKLMKRRKNISLVWKISSLKISIDTDFAINSISCECSVGPSRNPAQWRVSSHPVTVTTAAQPRTGHGKYFLKTSPKYFWVLWRILSQNLGWADHRSQPQVRVQSVQYNTHLYRITDIQLPPPQTHNLRLLLFTKCSECIKLKSFLQEGYLYGAIISLWQGSGWLKLNCVLNTTWF